MKHDRALELVQRQFEEGRLALPERRELRLHLRECDDCREAYDRLARLERALPDTDSSVAAEQRVWSATVAERAGGEAGPRAAIAPIQERQRPSRFRRSLLLAAAVILILLALPWVWPTSSIPHYSVSQFDGEKSMLSPGAETLRLHPGTVVTVVLRPDAPPTREVVVSTFFVRESKHQKLEWAWERSPQGSMRYRGVAGLAKDSRVGPATIEIFVGDRSIESPDEGADMQMIRRRVDVVK